MITLVNTCFVIYKEQFSQTRFLENVRAYVEKFSGLQYGDEAADFVGHTEVPSEVLGVNLTIATWGQLARIHNKQVTEIH